MTAEEHNELDRPERSPFTSWTHSREWAVKRALRHGPGGVLLRVPSAAPATTDTWNLKYSPDICGEQEILLRGIRMGIEVEKL